MVRRAWMMAVTAVGVLGLAACGGGGSTDGASGGGTSSESSSATSSSSGGAVGAGISCKIDGVLHTWPQGIPGANDAITISQPSGAVHIETPYTQGSFGIDLVKSPFMTGVHTCSFYDSQLQFRDEMGLDYFTGFSDADGACTITLTHVPSGPGDKWIGTFSGNPKRGAGASSGPDFHVVTEGTIDVVF